MDNKRNITLFHDEIRQKKIDSSNTYVNPKKNKGDFYLTVSLFKDIKLTEPYVEVFQDETKFTIPRQEINPYFYELGFFDDVNSISDLTGKTQQYNIEILK